MQVQQHLLGIDQTKNSLIAYVAAWLNVCCRRHSARHCTCCACALTALAACPSACPHPHMQAAGCNVTTYMIWEEETFGINVRTVVCG